MMNQPTMEEIRGMDKKSLIALVKEGGPRSFLAWRVLTKNFSTFVNLVLNPSAPPSPFTQEQACFTSQEAREMAEALKEKRPWLALIISKRGV